MARYYDHPIYGLLELGIIGPNGTFIPKDIPINEQPNESLFKNNPEKNDINYKNNNERIYPVSRIID